MKLYYIGHKKSEKINAYLAVTNDRNKAEKLLDSIKGAEIIVEREYDENGNLVKEGEV